MKFKTGDIIVYLISDGSDKFKSGIFTYGKTYEMYERIHDIPIIIDDNDEITHFDDNDFIYLSEYRERMLDEI